MQKETILSLWKEEFSENKNQSFIYDNNFGLQTKKDFILKAYLISSYIKKIPGDYIGIMIPSVSSSSILIISTYLAGKIPVMFNWTLGKDSFDHCVNFSKVSKILTSGVFYDKVKNDFLENYRNKGNFIFLEDLLKNISLFRKIKALFSTYFMFLPNVKNENAVILFTSGSESLPKAVPLTHQNLIENIKGALNVFELKQYDKLLGFLPPFHSFGFTINTIMPLITGMKVAYTPDPNDAKTIINLIKNCKITVITATPTFLKIIMSLATKSDFESINYVVVGAEKCSEDIFLKFSELCPNGKILEGYGITECSPVISINPINNSKPGTVGKILPCLECRILNLEKPFYLGEKNKLYFNEVAIGEQGMIYVAGKSIFNGYLDEKLENPFEYLKPPVLGFPINKLGIKDDTKKYYKTGDLGFIDLDGYLTITGRLKRFIKIAGEMISLPFVENILLEKYQNKEEQKIAIEALENDGNAKIVLFSVEHLEVEEVNDYLRKRGVSNLVKISEIIKIEKIPVLGTGKVDYKSLKKLIK